MIGLFKAFLMVTGAIARYVERKQLMDAGEAKHAREALEATLRAVDRAQRARRSVKHDADSVRDDPDRRD